MSLIRKAYTRLSLMTLVVALLSFGFTAPSGGQEGAPPWILERVPDESEYAIVVWVTIDPVAQAYVVSYELHRDAYVYILNIDSRGQVRLLFPNRDSQESFLRPGEYMVSLSSYEAGLAGTAYVQAIATAFSIDHQLVPPEFTERFPKLGSDPMEIKRQLECALLHPGYTGMDWAVDWSAYQVLETILTGPAADGKLKVIVEDAQDGTCVANAKVMVWKGQAVIAEGSTSCGDSVTKTFILPAGTYYVTCHKSGYVSPPASEAITVDIPSGGEVTAKLTLIPLMVSKFEFEPKHICKGEPVKFDASLTVGEAKLFSWDFGNSLPPMVTTERIVTHFFNVPRVYQVTLTAEFTGGTKDSCSKEVAVQSCSRCETDGDANCRPSEPVRSNWESPEGIVLHARSGRVRLYLIHPLLEPWVDYPANWISQQLLPSLRLFEFKIDAYPDNPQRLSYLPQAFYQVYFVATSGEEIRRPESTFTAQLFPSSGNIPSGYFERWEGRSSPQLPIPSGAAAFVVFVELSNYSGEEVVIRLRKW